ncbi:PTS IIB subunit [Agromyces sp. CFH 90414]|uniref:PTS IIB subunit n=1 Tax=Agromyces agglutinans TaxID=2662258 RepID=A0A6I2FH88_9MICO|nr:PTS IIB subunit [Agromyces agglutinans]MRG61303.1 PTS IIB subunit [Agromyces agglutinans]
MRIIVVCGAGASSTFVAHRLRARAGERGLRVEARAATEPGLPDALDGADVLLVGAHLASRIDEIRRVADAASVPVAILPESAAADDGAAALDLAIAVAGAGS